MNEKTYKTIVIPFGVFLIILAYALLFILAHDVHLHKEYMSGDDPNNPLKFGHLPITNEVKAIADTIVDKNDTPHEKCLKYMEWVDSNIMWKSPPSRIPTPDIILDSKIGLCGDFSYLTAAFLATQNITTRIIGMYNYNNTAHVGVEIFYDDAWHYYGPTYGAFWYDDCGRVLSFEELRAGGAYNASIYVYNKTRVDGFRNPEIYVKSNPAGVLGLDNPFIWPLAIGVNESYVVKPTGEKQVYRAGSGYIGATYINSFQNWTIRNLTPGKDYYFVIKPISVWGADEFLLNIKYPGQTFEKYTYKIIKDDKMLPVYIQFTASEETEHIELYHDYRGPNDVVLPIEKYSVIPVS